MAQEIQIVQHKETTALTTTDKTGKELFALCAPENVQAMYPTVKKIEDIATLGAEETTRPETMKAMGRRVGKETVMALIVLYVVKIDRELKQKNSLTDGEVKLVAEAIYDKYGGMLCFADMMLLRKKCVLGEYRTEFYESLTAAKMMDIVDMYANERMDAGYDACRKRDRAAEEESKKGAATAAVNVAQLMGIKDPINREGKTAEQIREERQHMRAVAKSREMLAYYAKEEKRIKAKAILQKSPSEWTDNEKNFILEWRKESKQ